MRGTSPPAFFLFGAVVLASLTLGLLGPINALRAQAPTGPDTTESTTEDSTGIVTGVTWWTITVDSRRGHLPTVWDKTCTSTAPIIIL